MTAEQAERIALDYTRPKKAKASPDAWNGVTNGVDVQGTAPHLFLRVHVIWQRRKGLLFHSWQEHSRFIVVIEAETGHVTKCDQVLACPECGELLPYSARRCFRCCCEFEVVED